MFNTNSISSLIAIIARLEMKIYKCHLTQYKNTDFDCFASSRSL